jgi:Mg2+-importing ATPase
LTLTTIATVVVGALLPLTPLAGPLGFVVPPMRFGAFVAVATAAYLALVQVAKVILLRRLAPTGNSTRLLKFQQPSRHTA